jgi:hypothetical protein
MADDFEMLGGMLFACAALTELLDVTESALEGETRLLYGNRVFHAFSSWCGAASMCWPVSGRFGSFKRFGRRFGRFGRFGTVTITTEFRC